MDDGKHRTTQSRSVSHNYKSCLIFLIMHNRKKYSCTSCLHMLAYAFRVGTASGNYFKYSSPTAYGSPKILLSEKNWPKKIDQKKWCPENGFVQKFCLIYKCFVQHSFAKQNVCPKICWLQCFCPWLFLDPNFFLFKIVFDSTILWPVNIS